MARSYPLNVVGRQVAKIRSTRGFSQSDLAAACQRMGWDVSRDTVAKIEGGFRWVGDVELVYLAKALKANVADLYPDEPLYRSCFEIPRM